MSPLSGRTAIRERRDVSKAVTVEVTFLSPRGSPGGAPSGDGPHAEGVVRAPDGVLRSFSGWLELLSILEGVVVDAGGSGG